MKKILKVLIWSFVLALCSCSTTYYIPNTQHVPVIDEKGETSITVAGNGNQAEFQAAYGVGESFAIMADGVVVFPQDDDNNNGGRGNLVDLGVGYFKPLSENLLFDTYAIVGFGKMENHFPGTVTAFPNTSGDISANLLRYGLQPSLSYHTDFFSITGSVRLVNLNYNNINGTLMFQNEGDDIPIDQIDYLGRNNSNFLIEPAITLRGGFEKAKLQLQYLRSFNVTNSDFPQAKDLISVGLNFSF